MYIYIYIYSVGYYSVPLTSTRSTIIFFNHPCFIFSQINTISMIPFITAITTSETKIKNC